MSFHLVYSLLLLQFVLGYAPFEHKSPGLSVLDTMVISGDYVCCSVVFGNLVGVFVFSVMWSELLMTSAISCSVMLSSMYECERVECAFTSPVRTKCGMFVMYCIQCCMFVSAVL